MVFSFVLLVSSDIELLNLLNQILLNIWYLLYLAWYQARYQYQVL
jgi:hypothetical protein